MSDKRLPISEETLRLEEEVAKRDAIIKAQNTRLTENQERIERLEGEREKTENAVMRKLVEKGEDTTGFAEAVRRVEQFKEVYQGILAEEAYGKVVELLDAKITLAKLENILKDLQAIQQSESASLKEAVDNDLKQLATNLGVVANALNVMIQRLDASDKRRNEVWNMEMQVLRALDQYLQKWK